MVAEVHLNPFLQEVEAEVEQVHHFELMVEEH